MYTPVNPEQKIAQRWDASNKKRVEMEQDFETQRFHSGSQIPLRLCQVTTRPIQRGVTTPQFAKSSSTKGCDKLPGYKSPPIGLLLVWTLLRNPLDSLRGFNATIRRHILRQASVYLGSGFQSCRRSQEIFKTLASWVTRGGGVYE